MVTQIQVTVYIHVRERELGKKIPKIFLSWYIWFGKYKEVKKKRKLYLFQVNHLESFSPLKPRIFFFKSSILCFAQFLPQ